MFFANTGVWIQRIAQDWLVLELTDSPTDVGITTMLQFLPMLLFGLVGGLIADRMPRRRILVGTQIAMMTLSAVLAALTLSGTVRPWHVFIVAFGVGTVFAFDIPARQAMVNDVVSSHQVRSAIGLAAIVSQLGGLIGPAVSGILIDAVGPGYSFTTTACMYLVPMAALVRMRQPTVQAVAPSTDEHPVTQLKEGLRYVARRRAMVSTVILVGTFGIFIANLPVTNAAYARNVFHSGPGGYGVLNSVGAIGSILGAMLAATRHRPTRLRGCILSGAALAALYIVASAVPGFAGYATVLILIGIATITFMTSCNALIQTSAEAHVRGRVMGLFNLVFIGGGAIGGPVIGAVDQYAGPRVGVLLSGLVPAVVTLLIAVRVGRASGMRPRQAIADVLAALPRLPGRTATPRGRSGE